MLSLSAASYDAQTPGATPRRGSRPPGSPYVTLMSAGVDAGPALRYAIAATTTHME